METKENSQTYKILVAICSIVVTAAIGYLMVRAGSLNPPGGPAEPTMKTLDDIYCAMTIDTTSTSYTISAPGSPTSTMHTLDEIYNIAVNFPIPDTGQTSCYDYDTLSTCPVDGSPGQDAEYTASNSFACDMSYTDNGDGTVTDNCTGLMWKKCSEPDTSTTTCGGGQSTYEWANALVQCDGLSFAGHTDWRLPNITELWSIVLLEYEIVSGKKAAGPPYINQIVFPNTVAHSYWSASTYPYQTVSALHVTFNYAYLYGTDKGGAYYVRCVRGQ